jgi:predicted acetyltransferase
MIGGIVKRVKYYGIKVNFYHPGLLLDNELQLLVTDYSEGDYERGYVPSYQFMMVNYKTNAMMGKISLRVVSSWDVLQYVGHIGYHVYPNFRGNHYAARSCKLLLDLARKHDINPLWITCNPDNYPSRRACELAGAELVEIVDVPKTHDLYDLGDHQKCRYKIDL